MKKVFVLVIALWVCSPVQGQLSMYDNFINYTTKDGLSQNDAMCIIQDKDGYIWIGTHDGLNRFDGYSFKTFISDANDPYSLGGNLISDMDLDSLGNLWISTWDNGISMFEKSTGRFYNYNNLTTPGLFGSEQQHCILVTKEGEIWVGGASNLENLVFNENHELVKVTHYAKGESKNSMLGEIFVNDLYQDSYGNVWISSSGGLKRFIKTDKEIGHVIHYPEFDDMRIWSVQEVEDGLVISGNHVYYTTFQSINASMPKMERLTTGDYKFSLVSSDKSVIWGGGGSGLHVKEFSISSQKPLGYLFTHQWTNPKSIGSNNISCIYEDNSGMIWVGTIGGGVSKYNPKVNFRHFNKNIDPSSLSHNVIRMMFEDSNENLWIGSTQQGVNILSAQARKVSYETGMINLNNASELAEMYYVVSASEITLGGQPYIALGGGYPVTLKLARFDEINGMVTFKKDLPKLTNAVFCSVADSNSLWIGTYHGGLLRYDFDEKGNYKSQIRFYGNEDAPNTLSSDIIRSLAFDHNGNLWIGTDKGVNKLLASELYKKKPHFIQYTHDPDDLYSLSRNYILPIMVTTDNEIWIGTMGGGLNKVIQGDKGSNDKFLRYTTQDGLPNNVIKAILEGDDGSLWISSNHGISHFMPEKLAVTNYGLSSGLQDLEFSEIAACKAKNGEMLFGGVNGFNSFFPDQIKMDSIPARIVLNNLNISNQAVEALDTIQNHVILNQSLNKVKKLKLRHTENSFSLEVSAIHYAAPEQNRYKYMLEGFDDQWIDTDASNRIIRYTNLPSGDYTLKVKASNFQGVWSQPKLLKIVVQPAPWFTTWAYMIYFALFATAIFFFRRFTIIGIENKNELVVEGMEREKTEELHQMKLKFFTNISHEFRTPLTLILGFTERLMDKSIDLKESDKDTYYEKIYRNSKILLNLVNQLLGFRKAEQGKLKIRASKNDITNYIQLLGANFYELANQKAIDFNVHFKDRIETWYDPEVLERVIFNLLSNAFKHTPRGGNIDITIERVQEYIQITVSDSGDGIPENMQSKIFERFNSPVERGLSDSGIGLSFVKTLVDLHHGQIMFDKNQQVGTTFIITLPGEISFFEEGEIVESNDYEINDDEMGWLLPSEEDHKDGNVRAAMDKTILVIEDNEDIRFFIKENFRKDYNILEASDGSQGLEVCLSNNIDMVISDLMMEGMDGLEFTDKLKSDERINHIPVIMLTAKGTPEDKLEGYSHGAEAYITKPFRIEELRMRMQAILQARSNIIGKLKVQPSISPSEVGMTSIDEKFLNRVMKYIEDNISNSEFTIEMLAHECGLSQHHLNKKLKALVGSTANAFVRTIRLKRATQLLLRNMYSVTEIMYEVGFNDAKYFRFCFKKEFGLTPTEYLKAHGHDHGDSQEDEDED